jgi:RHS repeat-associated protein
MYSYYYRADGLKSSETDTTLNSDGSTYDTRTLTWNYDALDRLTQEKSVDATNSALNYTDNYSYDLNSNRVTETEDQGNTGSTTDTVTSTYNADDELTQTVDANNGTTTYGYDANGSQTTATSPTGTTTNVYDLQGRVISVVNKNTSGVATSSATYEYDDSGNRIEETTVTGTNSPVTTYFLVDTQTATGYAQVIEQSQTPGTPTVTYVWGLNLVSQNNAAGTPNAGTYYFVVDGHGSTVALLDANGNVVQAFHYDGFGNALGFTPSSAITQYLYTQQYFDLASSTYYDWARNYNPGTGSFTQADYGNYGTLNDPMSMLPYAFTGGDPINMVDLNGHDFSIGSLTVGIGIASLLNASIGGIAGGVQNGILGALGGAVNGLVSTSVGMTAFVMGTGPFGFALGALAGEGLDMGILGSPPFLSPPWIADMAVSGVLGFVGGAIGGEVATAYAGQLGERLLQLPAIREEAAQITAGQGVHLASTVEFVGYYTDHPWSFFRILTKYVTQKSIG